MTVTIFSDIMFLLHPGFLQYDTQFIFIYAPLAANKVFVTKKKWKYVS